MGNDQDSFGFVGALWERMQGFFVAMWEGVWHVFTKIFPSLIDAVIKDVSKVWMETDDKWWDAFFEHMKSTEFMTDEQIDTFRHLKYLPAVAGWPLLSIFNFIVYSMQMKASFGPSATLAEQKQNAIAQPHLPDVSSLIQSAFIAPEKTPEIRELLKKHGLNDKNQDYMFLARYALYDVNMCRDLFLRGVLNGDELFMRMRELGFTDTRIKEIMKSWELIPGPSDLFHLVAKEAFEPDMIQKMGLDAEFPVEQTKWLKMQGFSEEWARKYWYAHWEMPSLQMGFDMLHRGVIDEDGLDMLFRSVEIPPFWRDKLTKITYNPYTRVDVRRMYNFNVLNLQDVYNNFKDLGSDHLHALKMTEWTAAQKDPINKDISMGQILSTFEDNVLERVDAKALLQDIGYSDQKAEFLLTAREFEIAQKLEKKQLKIIETKFTNRYIDKFETLRQLSLLNLPYKQQELLMQEWELDLMQDNKLPSKTDLEKFFLGHVITDTEYIQEMAKLGYNGIYTNWYLQMISKKWKGKADV
jgi:hypothetical protein